MGLIVVDVKRGERDERAGTSGETGGGQGHGRGLDASEPTQAASDDGAALETELELDLDDVEFVQLPPPPPAFGALAEGDDPPLTCGAELLR